MTCEIEWRPISVFKGHKCQWKAKRWDNNFDHTMAMLRDELDRNKIASAVIETYHEREAYTMSGRPRSVIAPKQPSVQMWFMVGKMPVCIPSAMYDDWVQNLKAIQMTLRGRRLERDAYGCATIEEQYRGHAQLPAGKADLTTTDSIYGQASFVLTLSKQTHLTVPQVLDDPKVFHEVFKSAAMYAHPDKGGSEELMNTLNRARDGIRASKGW